MSSVNIPSATNTVDVQIFDKETFSVLSHRSRYKLTYILRFNRPQGFMSPHIKGFDRMNALAYSFLITHRDASTGKERRLVFDLGAPKDFKNDLPPSVVDTVNKWEKAGIKIECKKYMSELLEENGIPLDSIESVIWSHPHWDHIGRPSLFPKTVRLIVGPGLVSQLGPGYPENQDSPFRSEAFANREVVELRFEKTLVLNIGDLRAVDFFGDGSLYFIDAPGHAVGHINALARTTKDTFIFMGADSFHHPAALRPSSGVPLPTSITVPGLKPSPCHGELFEAFHPCSMVPNSDPSRTPFVKVGEKSPAIDLAAARETLHKIESFDADPNILVIAAHDWSLKGVVEYYPQKANDWKAKGWKETGRWRFLADFQKAVDLVSKAKM